MRDDDLIRIRHMLDAVREAMAFAAGRDRSDLDTDRMLLLSLVKCVEILGEAASRVSERLRLHFPVSPGGTSWPCATVSFTAISILTRISYGAPRPGNFPICFRCWKP